MSQQIIALFGEAEKGAYKTPYFCDSLPQLVDTLGHPPEESQGLHYAVQTLLYQHDLIFFRVKEEGFSFSDYFWGFNHLQKKHLLEDVTAVCIPGVGDDEIIQSIAPQCAENRSFLIISEPDLYDFLHQSIG